MTWLLTISGVLLVLAALRDIFHTIWHPRGFGGLTRFLFVLVWRASKFYNRGGRSTELAGPIGLLVTGLSWAGLLILGFALIYLPYLPQDYYFDSAIRPESKSGFVTAVYLSMVALATLGLGDIAPEAPALRIAVPLEALVGFVLLSAVISWVLQLYPALTRRRALARRLSTMAAVGATTTLDRLAASSAVQLLEAVRDSLSTIEMDLLQYGESYYFREEQPELSLAVTLPHLSELIESGKRSGAADVRQAAQMLQHARDDLLKLLARGFLHEELDPEAALDAYLADHQQERSS